MANGLQIPLLFHFLCSTSPHWKEMVISSVTSHRHTLSYRMVQHKAATDDSHHLGHDAVLNGRQTPPTDFNTNQHYRENNKYSRIFILLQSILLLYIYVTKENISHETAMCHNPFIPLPCAECDDSSSIPLCYVLFPAILLHQLFFHPLSPHLAIYFLVYLSILLFPNSYIIPFCKFYFLPFSVTHEHTNLWET